MPDAENPQPKESESQQVPTKPTEISIEEFHERADYYLGELVQRLEEAQENDPAIEVDYSVRWPCSWLQMRVDADFSCE